MFLAGQRGSTPRPRVAQHGAPPAIRRQQQPHAAVHGAPSALRARQGKPTVADIQRRLRAQGYNVAVDGIWGPQTSSALSARNRHIAPSRWNAGARPTPQRSSGSGSSRSGGGGSGGGGGSAGRTSGGRSGSGGSGGSSPALKAIDANQYAQATTNLQFQGLLNELARQRDELEGQSQQNQSDIKSWFQQVADTAAQSTQSNDQASQHMMTQQGADFQGILEALGGSASGQAGVSLGNFQQALAAGLAGIGTAQHNFDTTRQTQVGQERATALTSQQNAAAQAMSDLNAKIAQANQDKSNSLVKNRFDAQQLRLQQLAAIQNMKITGKQFGVDMALKQAQLVNMNIANQALGNQLAQQLKNQGHGFRGLTAGDRAKLGEGANSVMYGANMATSKNPRTAWVNAANVLRSLGYDVQKNPDARRWLANLWMNYVTDYNHDHPNSKYRPAGNGTPWPDSVWKN